MEKWRTKGGEGGSRWNQKGTEDNCTFHPVTSRAARASTVAFSRRATRACARARPRLSRLGKRKRKKKKSLTIWAVDCFCFVFFLGPDRWNRLKYTQLSHTTSFSTGGVLDSAAGRISRRPLPLPPSPLVFPSSLDHSQHLQLWCSNVVNTWRFRVCTSSSCSYTFSSLLLLSLNTLSHEWVFKRNRETKTQQEKPRSMNVKVFGPPPASLTIAEGTSSDFSADAWGLSNSWKPFCQIMNLIFLLKNTQDGTQRRHSNEGNFFLLFLFGLDSIMLPVLPCK